MQRTHSTAHLYRGLESELHHVRICSSCASAKVAHAAPGPTTMPRQASSTRTSWLVTRRPPTTRHAPPATSGRN